MRKRPRPWEVIVIQDDGDRRGYSVACGIADSLWFDRNSSIFLHARDDNRKGSETNPYIVDQVKATKHMVPS